MMRCVYCLVYRSRMHTQTRVLVCVFVWNRRWKGCRIPWRINSTGAWKTSRNFSEKRMLSLELRPLEKAQCLMSKCSSGCHQTWRQRLEEIGECISDTDTFMFMLHLLYDCISLLICVLNRRPGIMRHWWEEIQKENPGKYDQRVHDWFETLPQWIVSLNSHPNTHRSHRVGIFVSLESCRCPAQHEGKKATFKSDTVATVTLIFAFLDILQFGFASGEKLENDIFKAISSYVRGCMLEVSVHKGTDNVLARLNPCPQRLRMGREMENFGPLCVCVRVFVCVCVFVYVCVCVCVWDAHKRACAFWIHRIFFR